MRILYHLTVPPSPMPACDAVVQEVDALRGLSGGDGQIVYLYPGRRLGTRFPRRWWGLQHLPSLRRAERAQRVDVHHIFNPDPFEFDLMRFLRRPIIYTAVAGARSSDHEAVVRLARRVHTLVVPDESERAHLREQGVPAARVVAVRPGIDMARFAPTAPPAGKPFTLLMGSAPWTVDQFESKGVEALLGTGQRRADLRLIFLWRGLHGEEMNRRVARLGLSDRVSIVDRVVDVNDVLAHVHAAVVLAQSATLVKAYPHSLLEALAVGRPVLVSRVIPMAAYVEQMGCGQVVEAVEVENLLSALAKLEASYESTQAAALEVGRRDFSQRDMVEAYRRLYLSALSRPAR
jgi:glycosyltransferase involved in cell wall biosynthesis